MFPYVQFSQFKVCNNKCELKVGKWARMNNLDENGNFLPVSLRKFGHLDRTHNKYLIQSKEFSVGFGARLFHKFVSAFRIPAVDTMRQR